MRLPLPYGRVHFFDLIVCDQNDHMTAMSMQVSALAWALFDSTTDDHIPNRNVSVRMYIEDPYML